MMQTSVPKRLPHGSESVDVILDCLEDFQGWEDIEQAVKTAYWAGWLDGNDAPKIEEQSQQNMVHRDRLYEKLSNQEPTG